MKESEPVVPIEAVPDDEASIPPERAKRLRLLGKRTLALSLATTLLASGIATETRGDAGGFARAVGAGITQPGSTTLEASGATGAGDPAAVEITATNTQTEQHQVTSQQTVSETKAVHADEAMPWALEFSQDPEARDVKQAEASIDALAGRIKHLEELGCEVSAVTLQGFASDEDDGTGGGLRVKSPKNAELADTRAAAVLELASNRLHRADIAEPVRLKPGQEVIDRQLDAQIDQLARERGQSTLELIQRYNRDRDAFSKAELKILDGLASDRFVRVEAVLTCDHEIPVTIDEAVTKTDGGSIIVVPVLLPVVRLEEAPRVVATQAAAVEPLQPPPPRPSFERAHSQRQAYREPLHSSAIHRKQPRPHNFHGGRLSTKGPNSGSRGGRNHGGNRH